MAWLKRGREEVLRDVVSNLSHDCFSHRWPSSGGGGFKPPIVTKDSFLIWPHHVIELADRVTFMVPPTHHLTLIHTQICKQSSITRCPASKEWNQNRKLLSQTTRCCCWGASALTPQHSLQGIAVLRAISGQMWCSCSPVFPNEALCSLSLFSFVPKHGVKEK